MINRIRNSVAALTMVGASAVGGAAIADAASSGAASTAATTTTTPVAPPGFPRTAARHTRTRSSR